MMMTATAQARASWFAAALAASVLATGCAGPEILDLNSKLTQLQDQRAMLNEVIDRGDGRQSGEQVVKRAQVEAALERVADTAAAAANKASDPRAKIAYYRIAATADWQRG